MNRFQVTDFLLLALGKDRGWGGDSDHRDYNDSVIQDAQICVQVKSNRDDNVCRRVQSRGDLKSTWIAERVL